MVVADSCPGGNNDKTLSLGSAVAEREHIYVPDAACMNIYVFDFNGKMVDQLSRDIVLGGRASTFSPHIGIATADGELRNRNYGLAEGVIDMEMFEGNLQALVRWYPGYAETWITREGFGGITCVSWDLSTKAFHFGKEWRATRDSELEITHNEIRNGEEFARNESLFPRRGFVPIDGSLYTIQAVGSVTDTPVLGGANGDDVLRIDRELSFLYFRLVKIVSNDYLQASVINLENPLNGYDIGVHFGFSPFQFGLSPFQGEIDDVICIGNFVWDKQGNFIGEIPQSLDSLIHGRVDLYRLRGGYYHTHSKTFYVPASVAPDEEAILNLNAYTFYAFQQN